MLRQFVSMATDALFYSYGWLINIFASTGMSTFYFVMFFILLLCRFLLQPLFGRAVYMGASDTVSKGRSYWNNPRNWR